MTQLFIFKLPRYSFCHIENLHTYFVHLWIVEGKFHSKEKYLETIISFVPVKQL